MPTPPAKVARLAPEGAELQVPRELAERAGLKAADELAAFAPGGGVLVLAREVARKGFLVGTLGALSVAELMGFVSSALRSVTLVLQGPTARRRFVFRDGQVVFASSTELSERLGPVLWRSGMITLEQLDQAEPKVSGGAKLGKVLVEAGVLSPAQLYRGMQLQVKEILFGAFVEAEGEFALVDEGENPELNSVRLQERSRDLVLEGLSRAEEMGLLRQQLDPSGVPRRKEGAAAPEGPLALAVWNKVDGRLCVRDVVRASRLGEQAALRALRELVSAGKVSPPPPAPPKAAIARQPSGRPSGGAGAAAQYRAAAEKLRAALGPQAFGKLACFPEALPASQKGLFEGVFAADGMPDFDKLGAAAQKASAGPAGRALAQDLSEAFLAFALFEARNALPAGKAGELARELARCLKGK